MSVPVKLFFSYAREDECLREKLETHLEPLIYSKLIEIWRDRDMLPGKHVDRTITKELRSADIVLLLISPDFLKSEYCREEVAQAMQLQEEEEITVVPVILRETKGWRSRPFGRNNVLPTDPKAAEDWPGEDGYRNIAMGIEDIAKNLRSLVEVQTNHLVQLFNIEGHRTCSFEWDLKPENVEAGLPAMAEDWKKLHTKIEKILDWHKDLVYEMFEAKMIGSAQRDEHRKQAQNYLDGTGGLREQLCDFCTDLRKLSLYDVPGNGPFVKVLLDLPRCVDPLKRSLTLPARRDGYKHGVILAQRIGCWLLTALHIADQVLEKYFREQRLNARLK
jgi:hypothetical protein